MPLITRGNPFWAFWVPIFDSTPNSAGQRLAIRSFLALRCLRLSCVGRPGTPKMAGSGGGRVPNASIDPMDWKKSWPYRVFEPVRLEETFWSSFSPGPKRLTFHFWVPKGQVSLWAAAASPPASDRSSVRSEGPKDVVACNVGLKALRSHWPLALASFQRMASARLVGTWDDGGRKMSWVKGTSWDEARLW